MPTSIARDEQDTYRMTGGSWGALWSTRAGRNVSRLLQNQIAPRHNTLEGFDHLIYVRLVFIECFIVLTFDGSCRRIDFLRDVSGSFHDRQQL